MVGQLCWLLARGLSSSRVGLSIGLLECPHTVEVAFPRDGDLREKGGCHSAFYDLVYVKSHHHFHPILFVTRKLLSLALTQKEENEFPPFEEKNVKEFMDIF